MITQAVIGTILQEIFQLPTGRIVPKQGNWWNPQDITNSGTWLAYLLTRPRPVGTSFWQENDDTSPIMTVPFMGEIEMQFVGPDAERLAQSVSLWNLRPDIAKMFDDNQAQLAYSGMGAYEVSHFTQSGLNSILAYNVRLSIQWANMIQVSSTLVTEAPFISGDLTVN